jgi:phytoene dehydrogenase-like protein
MGKRVLIVGAGISGLSAGCYALMNGFEVEIHESHDKPGGLCTAWKRKGYMIDGCVEWLTGSRPGSKLYPLWEELGVVQGREFVYHDIFSSIVGRDGRTVHLYTDIDKFEEHLVDLSPADSGAAKALGRLARKAVGLDMPAGKAPELAGWWDGVRMIAQMAPYLAAFKKMDSMTIGELASQFADTSIQKAISTLSTDPADPALVLFLVLGTVRDSGTPLGGSLEFARSLEKRLLDLGGEIHYRSRVAEVLERDGRAVGVRLEDGQEIGADYVVSACDMRWTLFSMLGGRHIDPVHKLLLDTGKTILPYMHVAFGVDMDFSDEIRCVGMMHELEQPVDLAGIKRTHLVVRNQCYDPATAPAGKSVVVSLMQTEWSHWEPLAGDRSAYKAEKERIAAFCREQIDGWYPGFSSKVEMVDVVTPLTFVRYTGNWKGSYMTWLLDSKFMRTHRYVPMRVPGLENFFLSSMWTKPPGGIPGAAMAGRDAAQLLCHDEGRRFETSKP